VNTAAVPLFFTDTMAFDTMGALVIQSATSAGIEPWTGVGDVAAAAVAGDSTAFLCPMP
jgi:hypothetical protein